MRSIACGEGPAQGYMHTVSWYAMCGCMRVCNVVHYMVVCWCMRRAGVLCTLVLVLYVLSVFCVSAFGRLSVARNSSTLCSGRVEGWRTTSCGLWWW